MNEATAGTVTSTELRYEWKIENFSVVGAATVTAVFSPLFSSAHSDNQTFEWRLILNPNGSVQDKNYIGIFLQNMNEFGISATYSLSIMNDSYKDVFEVTYNPIANAVAIDAKQSRGWPKFERKAAIMAAKNRTCLNDTLMIACSIFSATPVLNGYDLDGDGAAMKKYNESVLESGNYSDVTFSIEEKDMHLHKVIVAGMSPVFEAMFTNDMRESHDNLVVITDIKYDVMKELFRYIYTRKVNGIGKVAGDLLIAADKYDIKGLKMMCEVSLCSSLKDDNALQRLHLAVQHNAPHLKPKVVEYIVKKIKTFIGKAEFRDLTHDCKDEILTALANK